LPFYGAQAKSTPVTCQPAFANVITLVPVPNQYRNAGFVVLDEVEEFRRADTCIPGRLPKIPVMKKKAAEQVLHFLVEG
jgi:hypothetical protein